MPLKVSAGLSKKIGQENYGSLGASCHLELELDGSILEDAEAFREKVRRLYTLANQSISDQLAKHASGNGHANGNGRSSGSQHHAEPAASPTTRNGNGSDDNAPASERQIKYLLDLARGHTMDLNQTNQFCDQMVGVCDVYQLTKAQASRIIDHLAGSNGNGASNGKAKANGRRFN